jgi:hypothetical protein
MCARGATASEREEFAADAITIICAPRESRRRRPLPPPLFSYDPATGTLGQWLGQVLRRQWIDRCRRRRPLLPLEEAVLVPQEPGAPLHTASSLFAEPFCPRDLQRVEAWKVKDRIQLLCLSGLWLKVPEDWWERWVVEYEASRGLRLGRPFPASEVLALDSHNERKGPLSRALKIPLNTLDVYWHRKKGLLRELQCIREEQARGPE